MSDTPAAVAVGRLEGRDTYFQTWYGGRSFVLGSCLLNPPHRPALLHMWSIGLRVPRAHTCTHPTAVSRAAREPASCCGGELDLSPVSS